MTALFPGNGVSETRDLTHLKRHCLFQHKHRYSTQRGNASDTKSARDYGFHSFAPACCCVCVCSGVNCLSPAGDTTMWVSQTLSLVSNAYIRHTHPSEENKLIRVHVPGIAREVTACSAHAGLITCTPHSVLHLKVLSGKKVVTHPLLKHFPDMTLSHPSHWAAIVQTEHGQALHRGLVISCSGCCELLWWSRGLQWMDSWEVCFLLTDRQSTLRQNLSELAQSPLDSLHSPLAVHGSHIRQEAPC